MASKAIHATLQRHPRWTQEEKAAFAQTTYDLVRHWRLLWYLANATPAYTFPATARLWSTYQLYRKATVPRGRPSRLPAQFQKRYADALRTRALRYSVPEWLDALGQQALGPRWEPVLAAMMTPPDIVLRVNTLKTTKEAVEDTLRRSGIHTESVPQAPDALRLVTATNVFGLDSFRRGLFEVQDAASQAVSVALDPRPGMRVVDACAGEGGKSLHLAALMRNRGKIIALDTVQWRLQQLRRRAARDGVDTIETRLSSPRTVKRLVGSADRLLLDVPCSGLGTLRRNPDIKWKLTADALERLTRLQRTLLDTYVPVLKPMGRFVYATCSILACEGEDQLRWFLSTHRSFRLLSERRLWPDRDGTDGFYMALCEKI